MIDKVKIRELTSFKYINERCRNCKYWFEHSDSNLIDDFYRSQSIWDLIREKMFEKSTRLNNFEDFLKNNGTIIGAFQKRKNVGLIIAGKYYLFPKLKSFDVYRPDPKSIFLSCIYLEREYRKIDFGRKLLLYLVDNLSKKGFEAIESIGKRLTDDVYEKDYYNSPLIPVKFLIKNGFHIKKNDEFFPVLRIELKNLVKVIEPEEIDISEFLAKRKLKNQAFIKK